MRRDKPWEQSTGPRTAEGKAVSSRNADKGGHRPRHRTQMRLMREMSRAAREIVMLGRAAYADGNLWGDCIDPHYDRSEAFVAAWAHYNRARAQWWRIALHFDDADFRLPVEQDGYDLPGVAASMLAGMDAVPEGDAE